MLLKNKLFKKILLGLFCPIFFINLTSCFEIKINDRQINDEHFKFINELEFSLAAIYGSGKTITFGTAWIYKRLSNINDYCYELITNYHVYDGIRKAHTEPGNKYSLSVGFDEYFEGKEQHFGIKDYVQIQNYSFDSYNPFFISTDEYKSSYMDICGITIDFSSTVNTLSGQLLKNKLDNLNQNLINDKAIVINNKNLNSSEIIYMAGYPWETSKKESRNYTYFCEWYDNIINFSKNNINKFSDIEYSTNQDQYWLPNYSEFYLGGGASGSLVINENYEAVGIYWGGQGTKSSFKPSFASFYLTKNGANDIDFFLKLDDTLNKNAK